MAICLCLYIQFKKGWYTKQVKHLLVNESINVIGDYFPQNGGSPHVPAALC